MNEHDDVEKLLAGLGPPAPPAELRERTLRRAREVLLAPTDVWTRIWGSRALRLGWAASIALLLVGHAAVGPRRTRAASKPDATSPAIDRELTSIARLPRLDERYLPALGGVPERHPVNPRPKPGAGLRKGVTS